MYILLANIQCVPDLGVFSLHLFSNAMKMEIIELAIRLKNMKLVIWVIYSSCHVHIGSYCHVLEYWET